MPAVVRVLLGVVLGFGIAFGTYFGAFALLGAGPDLRLWGAVVAGGIGAVYLAIAMGNGVYSTGAASILGLVADASWSLLNSFAGMVVWLPACAIVGGTLTVDVNSRRSGTFAFDKNPRDVTGQVYAATTVGTVIGGGWSSHEEVHVWQARAFGPLYLVTYGLSLVLNMLFRLVVFNTKDIPGEAYGRVCYEDWAYWAGEGSGSKIHSGGWIGGFFLAALYVGLLVAIPVGIATGTLLVWIIGAVGVVVFSVVRALTPKSSP